MEASSQSAIIRYLKGSGLACSVTLLLFIFYTISLGDINQFLLLAFILTVHTYAGAAAGELLLQLLKPLETWLVYPLLGVFIFGSLGALHGLFIILTYDLVGFFIGVTMASSISFFFSPLIKSRPLSFLFAAMGPSLFIIILLSSFFAKALGQN
ncbi:hypothetical protein [Alteribacillus sp. HJP-4]|uniref:hypothetical protein n=1 Tax=Alteribacillus sp. HJP-4 TaxID=2775394 RepID=UPI0035CCE34A